MCMMDPRCMIGVEGKPKVFYKVVGKTGGVDHRGSTIYEAPVVGGKFYTQGWWVRPEGGLKLTLRTVHEESTLGGGVFHVFESRVDAERYMIEWFREEEYQRLVVVRVRGSGHYKGWMWVGDVHVPVWGLSEMFIEEEV